MNQYFNDHCKKFKEKISRKQFKFDDSFWYYVNGDKEKFRRPWILLHICFGSWDIIQYDFGMAFNNDKKFEESMEAICNMLPHFLLVAGFSASEYKDLEGPMPFQCRQEPPPKVLQTRKM